MQRDMPSGSRRSHQDSRWQDRTTPSSSAQGDLTTAPNVTDSSLTPSGRAADTERADPRRQALNSGPQRSNPHQPSRAPSYQFEVSRNIVSERGEQTNWIRLPPGNGFADETPLYSDLAAQVNNPRATSQISVCDNVTHNGSRAFHFVGSGGDRTSVPLQGASGGYNGTIALTQPPSTHHAHPGSEVHSPVCYPVQDHRGGISSYLRREANASVSATHTPPHTSQLARDPHPSAGNPRTFPSCENKGYPPMYGSLGHHPIQTQPMANRVYQPDAGLPSFSSRPPSLASEFIPQLYEPVPEYTSNSICEQVSCPESPPYHNGSSGAQAGRGVQADFDTYEYNSQAAIGTGDSYNHERGSKHLQQNGEQLGSAANTHLSNNVAANYQTQVVWFDNNGCHSTIRTYTPPVDSSDQSSSTESSSEEDASDHSSGPCVETTIENEG